MKPQHLFSDSFAVRECMRMVKERLRQAFRATMLVDDTRNESSNAKTHVHNVEKDKRPNRVLNTEDPIRTIMVMKGSSNLIKVEGFVGSFDVGDLHDRMSRLKEVEADMKPAMNIRKPIRGIKNPNYEKEHAYAKGDQIGVSSNAGQMSKKSQDGTTMGIVNSWSINEANVETLFRVKFTSLSDIDDFSMSIKEGKYADILSTMSSADIDAAVNTFESIGKKFQDEVNKAGSLVVVQM
uniref:Uncharacterized protein n=1 Tax=Tanacetum cinerariifolium TaxID=118510 RepID=A0A6L2KSD9_TANCI|nr:hypothetical protein [Tanacetum cinerariifolium]